MRRQLLEQLESMEGSTPAARTVSFAQPKAVLERLRSSAPAFVVPVVTEPVLSVLVRSLDQLHTLAKAEDLPIGAVIADLEQPGIYAKPLPSGAGTGLEGSGWLERGSRGRMSDGPLSP